MEQNIILHPLNIEGEEDRTINLYPKTKKSNIIDFPTEISEFNNDSGYLTEVYWDEVLNKPFATEEDIKDLFRNRR